jgi:hypothetical protein
MNFIVETKKEYTTNLINIITPFLYEGFKSIYDEAIKVSNHKEELKTFQIFLQRILNWKDEIIMAETKRILLDSGCSDILEDLLKAVIKSNIMVLTNTPPDKKNKLQINYIIEFNKFIHYSYIESAKAIFQNPFLFLHNIPDNEKSRNKKETIELIKNCIEEAIRKMIPLDLILKEYLGNSYSESNNNMDKSLSNRDKSKLMHLIKADDINHEVSYQLTKKNTNKEMILKKEKDISPKQNINKNNEIKKNIKKEINCASMALEPESKLSGCTSMSESYMPINKQMDIFESYTVGINKTKNDTINQQKEIKMQDHTNIIAPLQEISEHNSSNKNNSESIHSNNNYIIEDSDNDNYDVESIKKEKMNIDNKYKNKNKNREFNI